MVFQRTALSALWELACVGAILATPLALAGPVVLVVSLGQVPAGADVPQRLLWASLSAVGALATVGGALALPVWLSATRRRVGHATLSGDELHFQPYLCAEVFRVPRAAIEGLEETPHGLVVRCGQAGWHALSFPLLIPLDRPAEARRLFTLLAPALAAPVEPAPGYSGEVPRGRSGAASRRSGLVELLILGLVSAFLALFLAQLADSLSVPEQVVWARAVLLTLALVAALVIGAHACAVLARFHTCRIEAGQVRFQGPLGEESLPLASVTGHRWSPGLGLWLQVPTRGWRERFLPRPGPGRDGAGARGGPGRAAHGGRALLQPGRPRRARAGSDGRAGARPGELSWWSADRSNMAPVGFAPTTPRLRAGCSAVELGSLTAAEDGGPLRARTSARKKR